MKVSDYIAEFFIRNGINTLFTITGGFSMHLNDSFGNNKYYQIYYQHHEQACGYSAVGYSKTNNKSSIVCTTAGCAATNAITPCLVAYQDSLPVLFISGQVKSTETITILNNDKMKLRHYAGADCDIISMVSGITKYAKELLDVSEVKMIVKEALYHLKYGRKGPVWLSIPIDIQSMNIPIQEEDYQIDDIDVNKYAINSNNNIVNDLIKINELLKNSKRPVIIAGNGIKLSDCIDKFNKFIDKYKIPVIVTIMGTDTIVTGNELYSGKIGLIGDRHGNFTLQNCDLILSLGCRMAQGIIGYRSDWFSREAKIIYIDNDTNELQKENIHYELKVNMDLDYFFDNYQFKINNYQEWIEKCNHWKKKWIFEMPPSKQDNIINPYNALKIFYDNAPSNKISVCSSGSIVTNIWHMVNIKYGDKFLISSQGDMGFEIPASIGSQIAEPNKSVYCILGDGSFQLNIQELQTIIQYKLPIKILLFNNGGYGAIEITQTNFFKKKYGVDISSGLSFPNTEKIANAYGIKYLQAKIENDLDDKMEEFINFDEDSVIFEIYCCTQTRYPRLNAMKNEDGTFINRPFEDMEPFLTREELKNEMIVKIV
jgi:acetolactate synthase-1/2/3 large subunit